MTDILNKTIVLVLNRNWQAINIRTPQDAFCQMATNVATALDIESDEHIWPVKWDEWITLPVREHDAFVRTARGAIRVPTVIVAVNYARVPKKRPKLSAKNIRERDGNRCQYTGVLLHPDEGNIVLPLENDALANQFKLRSKRGVMLYGPPGTGKATVGRALAHRLKGKFFLIDGTFIAGTQNFYERISQVFEAAKDNAPSVIFIDDADTIFEDGEERGLYRYLLTMLDGLESESAGRICVMMTAMNVANLPPALTRSGRVELWLEMKLPDAEARGVILSQRIGELPDELRSVDITVLTSATEGFTGADLKRLVEDGKAIYAYDKAKRLELKSPTDYFLKAVEGVRENKQRFAEAEAQAALKPKLPLTGFNSFMMRSFVTGGEEE